MLEIGTEIAGYARVLVPDPPPPQLPLVLPIEKTVAVTAVAKFGI